MAITNTQLAQDVQNVILGHQSFVQQTIDYLTSTDPTIDLTDPYTLVSTTVKTYYQIQQDYDDILDPVSGTVATTQQLLADAQTALTDAQNAQATFDSYDATFQGYLTTASGHVTSAQTAETNAGNHEAKAQEWAEKLEDTEVETGKYSALHHAAKAEDHATAASTSASNAATSETNAATSASNAATSETNAANSASAAASSATDAQNAAASVVVASGNETITGNWTWTTNLTLANNQNSALQVLVQNDQASGSDSGASAQMEVTAGAARLLNISHGADRGNLNRWNINPMGGWNEIYSISAPLVMGTHTTNDFVLGTNRARSITIKGDNQYVGIGTAAPGFELDVVGSSIPFIRIHDTDANGQARTRLQANTAYFDLACVYGGGSPYFSVINSSGNSVFRITDGAPSDSIRVASDGKVGIGASSPAENIHVADAVSARMRLEDSGGTATNVQAAVYGYYGATQAWVVGMQGADTLTLRNDTPAGNIALQAGGSNTLWVTDDAKIGIGTSSPARKLTIDGGADNEVVRAISSDAFCLYEATDSGGTFSFGVQAGDYIVRSGGVNPFQIDSGAPVNSIRVAADGKVGIGTGAPQSELDVDGYITSKSFLSVAKPADEPLASNTTLQDDDDLTLALEASTVYEVRLYAIVSAVDGGLKFNLSYDGIAVRGHFNATGTSSFGSSGGLDDDWVVFNGASDRIAVILGIIKTDTAGNLKVRWAQNSAHATASKMLEGSSLTARKLG